MEGRLDPPRPGRSKGMWVPLPVKEGQEHLTDGKHPGAGEIKWEQPMHLQHLGSGKCARGGVQAGSRGLAGSHVARHRGPLLCQCDLPCCLRVGIIEPPLEVVDIGGDLLLQDLQVRRSQLWTPQYRVKVAT